MNYNYLGRKCYGLCINIMSLQNPQLVIITTEFNYIFGSNVKEEQLFPYYNFLNDVKRP